MLVFCLLCLLPPTVTPPPPPPFPSTSLSSLPHPSFPLLSFLSPALSFSPVAGANCDIPLHFDAGATLSWDAAKRRWGGGTDAVRGMGDCTSTDRHIWLASLTRRNYIHNAAVYSQRAPPTPMTITSSPVGARLEPGEKQHQHQSGVKTLLSSFFCGRVFCRWWFGVVRLVAEEAAQLI